MEISRKAKTGSPKRRRILSLLGAVLCILFGFILTCNLTIIIKGTMNPERPPSILGVTPMVVLSGSMSGTQEGHIEAGDLIFANAVDPATLEVGDVIAYMSGRTTVTHRITAIDAAEDGEVLFTTKGDANEVEDTEPVTVDQLVGMYLGRIPKIGDFALFLQQPLGMLVFIGIPLFAFVIYDILRRQRYARREQQKAREMESELARLRSLAEQGQATAGEDEAQT